LFVPPPVCAHPLIPFSNGNRCSPGCWSPGLG
jgi:hypothetical protein